MKLPVNKLTTQHLATPKLCYLITGDEPLQVQEARAQVLTALKQQGYTDHIRFSPNDTAWHKLSGLCMNQSLFATRQVIDIRLQKASLGRDGSKPFTNLLNTPPRDTIFMLTCPRLDSNAQKSAWVKACDKHGLIIQAWPLSPQQLTAWIKTQAKAMDLQLHNDVITLLCDYTEGNLLACKQSLEKLLLLTEKTTITVDIMQQVLSDSSHYDIFAWADACTSGDQTRQTKILARLKAEGIEPILILYAIAREIKQLMNIHQAHHQGSPLATLWSKFRIFPKKQPMMKQLIEQVNVTFWDLLLPKIAEIDSILKGANTGNAWYALHNLGTTLSLRQIGLHYG